MPAPKEPHPNDASLCFSARHSGGELIVQVADDGRGIDWQKLAESLTERGLPAETRDELIEGLFSDGVSTAAQVSEVSGRGVGMSALRDTVRALGGSIRVTSEPGRGTTLACHFSGVRDDLTRRVAAFGQIQLSVADPP